MNWSCGSFDFIKGIESSMGIPEGASGASADAPVVGLGMVSVSNSLKKN